jgi:hypothetical protein
MSTTPPASPPGSDPLEFSIAGRVTVWDPDRDRHLEIGLRTFRVAPAVLVAGLAAGVQVTVTGYVEHPVDESARWIVTQLTVD